MKPAQRSKHLFTSLALLGSLFVVSGPACTPAYKEMVGSDSTQLFSRIYFSDFNLAWQSVLESLKNLPLDVTNRESGFIQTKYAENTAQKRFSESFGNFANTYVKAQYRFKITVATGYFMKKDKQSVKVTVQKEQMIQRDVLEGWRPADSDQIEENTLLYRIGRIIAVKQKLAALEEEKRQKAIDETTF